MTSANTQSLDVMAEQEAVADRFVGHWPQETLERIVRGQSFLDVLSYSSKRIAVFERAALIRLDVLKGQRPSDPTSWSRENLEKRIAAIRANQVTPPKASIAPESLAGAWDRITRAESISERKRKLELAEAERGREHLKAAQVADLALSPEERLLKRQIAETSSIISSKVESLYSDTMNERAHDRLYESVEKDRARLVTLTAALANLRNNKS